LVNENGDAQKSTMHRFLGELVKEKLIKKLRKSRYELTPYGQKEVERLKNEQPA
jgi:DNA-binding IclR family transcriptional regulator